jgi:hypothetical protein
LSSSAMLLLVSKLVLTVVSSFVAGSRGILNRPLVDGITRTFAATLRTLSFHAPFKGLGYGTGLVFSKK